MITSKTSNYIGFDQEKLQRYVSDVDGDLKTIFLALNGRIRLGAATDGTNGENVAGQFQQFTSHATPDTEFAVAHTLGSVPVGYLLLWQSKAGQFYQGPSTGTAWTATNIYLKNTVASVTASIFLVK